MNVGRSGRRTPAKHAFLNAVLGAEIGAAAHAARRIATPYQRHWFLDLTAGDGIAYHGEGAWHRACSPGILAHHARWNRCPVPVRVVLIERQAETFGRLVDNLKRELPSLDYEPAADQVWTHRTRDVHIEAIHADSRDYQPPVRRGDFVFVNNDPNNVNDWALPQAALAGAVATGAIVRSFNTMGCNADGLKRLKFAGGRERWYAHVDQVLASVSRSQDLLLFAIDRDDAQWGYLIVTPTKWAGRDAETAGKTFGRHGMTVTSVSLRAQRERFLDLLDRLFLTARERREREDGLW